ncbi:hypothetical protein BDV96DRAFT_616595 [Lophiotrema nucula]|uniref:Major facilitator superfamily domain-containing protein n=1 Tax=Lophiotrema nucula TaxID=690887 RepID=A0A6A5YNX0_9PLEO|nr:hypothetical protein BDV96DRAFT_616595 [Lophiotrema nucula]
MRSQASDEVEKSGAYAVEIVSGAANEAKALEKKVNLKLEFIVVLVLAMVFIPCSIDNTNIGHVATTNTIKDANITHDEIADSVSILSATFITLQPMSTAIGRRNRGTLIALRLLLEGFEAGFVPTSFYYLSTIYPKYSLGFRLGAFAGLIAYGIFRIRSSSLHNWQLLSVIEGALSVFMAVITVLVLPASLDTAWFFKPPEAAHAVSRMEEDVAGASEEDAYGKSAPITRRDVLDAVADWKTLITVVFNILATLPVSAFSYFIPLIVKGMGYLGVKASLMSVSPFAVGALVMYPSNNHKLRYGFIHVCLAGAFTAGPLIVASIIIEINGWSNLAGVIAGQLFKARLLTVLVRYPLLVTMILIAIGAIGFLSIRILLMWINHKRVRVISTWRAESFEKGRLSTERRGDPKLTFRYGY